MRPYFLILSIIGFATSAWAQPKPVLYPALSKTLDSLAYVDQWPMQQIVNGRKVDSLGNSLVDMEKANFARHQPILERILGQHGYPGFGQVGEKSSNNFWLLVQHADAHLDFQRRVSSLMLPEVKRKNASPVNYAYLTDRIAINTGQPEEYGTQVKYEGSGLGKVVPVSLRDPKSVNRRRAAIGMEPLESYLKWMSEMHVRMNTPQNN